MSLLGMAAVQWHRDELAAANVQTSSVAQTVCRCCIQTRIYESAQVKTRASEIPISDACIAPTRT